MTKDARFEIRLDQGLRDWLHAQPGRGASLVRDLLEAAREDRIRIIPRAGGPPLLDPFPAQPKTLKDQDVLLVYDPTQEQP